MLRLGVLVSGGGTNLQAIIDRIGSGDITDTEIAVVIASREDAYALKRAEENGIRCLSVVPGRFTDKSSYEEALAGALDEAGAELIVLAGFMIVLSGGFVKKYEGRIINIHPSLIPSFCGNGCYGLKVHEKVLDRGVKITGATVHFVDSGTDTGPIIMQKAVKVLKEDTPESLQRRVMEEAEWEILPAVINAFAHNRIILEDNRAYMEE
ncbi:MAG TPA: phosphoribosylglycinamide formyltransferase [Lachnospiraceae bacterium]|nr:phosphoribosylglycinamide formyltransferase [Lachnospiraceae bacterium]